MGNKKTNNSKFEIIIVDSGSKDRPLEIARNYNCIIRQIDKKEFSFGKSLNVGCETAGGEFLVFLSGHCIPVSNDWLVNLIYPLQEQIVDYVYGRQIGRNSTKLSEIVHFNKTFPDFFERLFAITGQEMS